MAEVYSWHSVCLNLPASRLRWKAPRHPDFKVLNNDSEDQQPLSLYNFVQLSKDFTGFFNFFMHNVVWLHIQLFFLRQFCLISLVTLSFPTDCNWRHQLDVLCFLETVPQTKMEELLTDLYLSVSVFSPLTLFLAMASLPDYINFLLQVVFSGRRDFKKIPLKQQRW